jgi:phytoene dehydrogenase-like protein
MITNRPTQPIVAAPTAVSDVDVIVIGAGHNGLVAANYIADSGDQVLVVEANDQVGGLTSSGRTIPEAPDHLIHHFSFDPFFWDSFPAAKELRLEEDYGWERTRVDPGLVYLHPSGESVAFWEDPAETAKEISHFSRADGRAYMEFSEVLLAMSDILLTLGTANVTRLDWEPLLRSGRYAWKWRHRLNEVMQLALGTAAAAIDERFQHPVVLDVMHAVAGSMIPNSQDGSGLGFLWLANQHRHSHRHPKGGIQSLPDALTRRLRAKGGEVRLGARVTEIEVRHERASAIGLQDGSVIRARNGIVAACDPYQTFTELLPRSAVPEKIQGQMRALPVRCGGYGQMKVDMAFKGQLQLSRHARWRADHAVVGVKEIDLRTPMHVIGTSEGVQRAFARSQAGLLPYEDDFSFWNAIPTGVDPSQAPDGQDNFYGYCATAPLEAEGGWTPEIKRELGQRVVNKFAKFYDGVEELELGRQVATNDDFAMRGNMTEGNLVHVDMILSRGGPLRPAAGLGGYSTPITALYLTGAGTHPGGGITGAPGYMTAREYVRDQKLASARTKVRRLVKVG